MLVQIDEVQRTIRTLSSVTKLSPVDAHNGHGTGWGTTLKCASCPDCCGKRQEVPVQISRDRETQLACLQDLLKRLQTTVSPDTPNVLQTMMKLEQAKARAKHANKVTLQPEKEKDTAEKAVEELNRYLQPKRTHTDDDVSDAHDLLVDFDNCDLSDHRREGTRVQNRRNVQVGSRDNQQKPRLDKDGFLYHTRLGLVGWISYWYYGDAAVVVVILVALINTLGLTELVSDAIGSRKQKETETNTKIVDLLKHALDETKRCRNEQLLAAEVWKGC